MTCFLRPTIVKVSDPSYVTGRNLSFVRIDALRAVLIEVRASSVACRA